MLEPEEFKRALLAIQALGSTPALLVKVVSLAKRSDTHLDRLCDLIRNDTALVADIIRLSNSPYYAPARPHSNLHSAVGHIGLREVVRVISLSLARRLFARDLACYSLTALDNWSAAVAAALLMEALAKHVRLNPEDAHTIGILHRLGCVLIDQVNRDLHLQLAWDGQQAQTEWERQAVGFDFAETGALLLEHWLFPASVFDVIRHQLEPPEVTPPLAMLDLLQFTHRVLDHAGSWLKRPQWSIPESDPFLQAAQLNPTALHQMIRVCRSSLISITDSLGTA